jgi:hypothetical protein
MNDDKKNFNLLKKLIEKKTKLIEEINILIQQLKDLDYGIFILLNKEYNDKGDKKRKEN